MDELKPVKLQVTCIHMRHKLMYVDERHAQIGMVDTDSDTRVYLCAKTEDALGPDNEATHPDVCKPDRGCYERDA